MEKIILICGRSGSGKGMLARFIADRYGALMYSFSDPLHAILSDLDMPNTRENLSKLSLSLRKNLSENILGLGAREYIEKNTGKPIILEGIRRIESLKGWEDQIDHIIWIDVKPEIRYSRMLIRKEKSAEEALSYEAFLLQESRESELSLEKLKEKADIVIENNGLEEEFFGKIDSVYRSLA